MPMFVILGNFTQKRMDTIKDLPRDAEKGKEVFKSFGVKIKELIFTMGRYDVVALMEAPDAETMTKALLSWERRGLLRTETLTGFTADKMVEVVKETK